ncbi:hypothetical protein FA13DRAFT_1449622 [Coprinellus micaceus]|uniref:Major facilitator superfamily (MFS) profile domain-containing protein n=1 Tax=Coprinellus micaceus TaxID=71717 RepID=A0A4Y7TNW1_COPMI|nr:hypothetical protein FA13DRAFT_1449622 [Coprinellus micaceus]
MTSSTRSLPVLAPRPPLPDLSTLTRVHVPDHAPKVLVPRHADRAYQRCDTIDTLVASTPSAWSPRRSRSSTPRRRRLRNPLSLNGFAWRIASGYFAYFLCGWGDGVMATVLPHLMEDFNITFMTGSLFYAASTIGFLTGTFLLERILKQLGRISRTGTRTSLFPFYPSIS